jgi:hypothetical protein
MVLILGNKCCNRGRLGVVLEPGYKYKPLVFVIGIEQFHNKPAPCNFRFLLVVSSSSSRGAIDQSTSVSTGNLVSCLYHAVDLDRNASSLVTMLSIMRWI